MGRFVPFWAVHGPKHRHHERLLQRRKPTWGQCECACSVASTSAVWSAWQLITIEVFMLQVKSWLSFSLRHVSIHVQFRMPSWHTSCAPRVPRSRISTDACLATVIMKHFLPSQVSASSSSDIAWRWLIASIRASIIHPAELANFWCVRHSTLFSHWNVWLMQVAPGSKPALPSHGGMAFWLRNALALLIIARFQGRLPKPSRRSLMLSDAVAINRKMWPALHMSLSGTRMGIFAAKGLRDANKHSSQGCWMAQAHHLYTYHECSLF